MRLQKFLAQCGVASRRKAEELIVAGKVAVNGKVVTELGTKIDPQADRVTFKGKQVKPEVKKIYIKINKPRGYVSSCRKYCENTIMDLVRDIPFRLFPVGRLDRDSEGLMILTNDGDLANKLMHPRYEHEKEYLATVRFPMTSEKLRILSQGIVIDGKKTMPAKVKLITPTEFQISLREGKKRQIRRMIGELDNTVLNLKRIRIENINLEKLAPGKWEYLSQEEIAALGSLTRRN